MEQLVNSEQVIDLPVNKTAENEENDDLLRDITHELKSSKLAIQHLQRKLDQSNYQRDSVTHAFEELNLIHLEVLSALEEEKDRVAYPLLRRAANWAKKWSNPNKKNVLLDRIQKKVADLDSLSLTEKYIPVIQDESITLHDAISPATENPDIFIFSIINWDYRVQRPQHIARELARDHRVFYIEMETSVFGLQLRQIEKNLYCVRLPSKRSGFVQPYTSELSESEQRGWAENIFELCDFAKSTATKQVVIQHPWWWQILRGISPEFVMNVDCMDDISGFSNTKQFILDLESDMHEKCEKLIVSSQALLDRHEHERETHLIRNAGEIQHFDVEQDYPVPEFLQECNFEKLDGYIDVGYVGAIADWFDVDLLYDMAVENSDFRIHLCGAVTTEEAKRLESLSNVVFYGEVKYGDVPGFLQRMDVLTIPFQILPIIKACDPVKFYEYSAMCKPTVATRMPELNRASDIVFLADNATDFATEVRRAYDQSQNPVFQKKLSDYAFDNTWSQRAEAFKDLIDEFPKVSVVVLSYGDPSWVCTTIHSIYEDGKNYQNLEVLIVDNGSSEENLDIIRAVVNKHETCRIIENKENLGFAKGNNVGIDASTGEYVLLLNNDTYLAPGAIHAMVSHLRINKHVGAVGPLTNNIGNEAKLFVEYPNIQEMKRRSRDWLYGYRNLHTEINTVAYFAVMMRRDDFATFGVLSEEYGLGMFEDDDHCREINKSGFKCVLAEDAFVHHHLSATFSTIGEEKKKKLFERNKAIYEKKWGEWIPHQYRSERPDPSQW